MANNGLFYLKKNYCCKCRRWIRPKSVLFCPDCGCPLRLGNGASKRKHGIKISGITGKVVMEVDGALMAFLIFAMVGMFAITNAAIHGQMVDKGES